MSLISPAQDSWKVKLNSKVILSAVTENEITNTKKLNTANLNKKGSLDILYKQAKTMDGWKRSLLFFDENDNELFRKDSIGATTRFSNSTIKEWVAGKKKLKIYTVSLPTDPNKAAAIRVRRVHLCTLELE